MDELANFNKLLVSVDYSEYSQLAGRFALKIAQKANSEIVFFHVFYSPAFDLIELTGNRSTKKELREDVIQKILPEETEKMKELVGSIINSNEFKDFPREKIGFEIRPGLPKEEIPAFCSELKPDLVIMGTRGKNKKENSLLGSIAEYVIKKLPFPVLAIPENYVFPGKETLRKIVYLTSFDESDFLSIRKLMGLTSLMNLEIYCLHMGEACDSWDMIRMDGLKSYFKKAYRKLKIECEILPQENLLQSLDFFIMENKINLISFTSRKRNVIEKLLKPDLTKQLFNHSSIPLLVFHS